jgi:hypothetical protein
MNKNHTFIVKNITLLQYSTEIIVFPSKPNDILIKYSYEPKSYLISWQAPQQKVSQLISLGTYGAKKTLLLMKPIPFKNSHCHERNQEQKHLPEGFAILSQKDCQLLQVRTPINLFPT